MIQHIEHAYDLLDLQNLVNDLLYDARIRFLKDRYIFSSSLYIQYLPL